MSPATSAARSAEKPDSAIVISLASSSPTLVTTKWHTAHELAEHTTIFTGAVASEDCVAIGEKISGLGVAFSH